MISEFAPNVGSGCTNRIRNNRRCKAVKPNRMPNTKRGWRRFLSVDAETRANRNEVYAAKHRKVA